MKLKQITQKNTLIMAYEAIFIGRLENTILRQLLLHKITVLFSANRPVFYFAPQVPGEFKKKIPVVTAKSLLSA